MPRDQRRAAGGVRRAGRGGGGDVLRGQRGQGVRPDEAHLGVAIQVRVREVLAIWRFKSMCMKQGATLVIGYCDYLGQVTR